MNVNFQAIPLELQQLNNWCMWKYEDIGARKPTKVPYNPNTGKHADVTDARTWASFQDVFNCFNAGGYSGIGFIFSANHPYFVIDLDDTNGDQEAFERQLKIYKEFDTYSELSPSGKGVHLIGIGKVPSGRRRNFIEVYSSERYITFTGNVHNHKPIKDCQEILTQLWEQMGGTINNISYDGNAPETAPDNEILTRALNASNGDKFEKLLNGNWQELYQSQSEADYAFIDIIAYYTQNKAQIARIFRASKLGQRDKAKRVDYVDRMILQSFDNMVPPIDFDGFKNALEEIKAKGRIAQSVEPTAHNSIGTGSSPVAPTNDNGVLHKGSASGFGPESLGSIPSAPANQQGYFNANYGPGKEQIISQETLSEQQRLLSQSEYSKNNNVSGMVSGVQENSEMRNVSGNSYSDTRFSSQRPETERNNNSQNSAGQTQQGKDFRRNQQVHSSLQQLPSQITLPPGLIGHIAQFIYSAAPRPVPEIALAGALGLMAGICGKAYNISNSGLNQYIICLAKTGCHALGTPILMYNGSIKAVEDIQIDDLLMGPDSKPRKVLSLARGKEVMYEIIPTKGEAFVVNENHILHLIHTSTKKEIDISVKDWLMTNQTFKHLHKLKRTGVEFDNDQYLNIDPWLLGALLGDGQLGPRISLTSQDECIRNRAKDIIENDYDMKIISSQIEGNKSFQDVYVKKINSYKVNERKSILQKYIEELELFNVKAGYKFIPEIYKRSSKKNRLELLAGLIDTDGSLSNGNYDYISKSEQLAIDITFVARSVGLAAYLSECEKYNQFGTGGVYYRVCISGNINIIPVTLEYKKAKPRKQKKDVCVTGFSVQELEKDDFYGFNLDNDHLYLTGDFTIHHNSGKEGMAAGIDKLISAVKMSVPTATEFIGPAYISSGQALVKHIHDNPCFVSILGEFGLRVQAMSGDTASAHERMLKQVLLEVYQKSGSTDIFRPSIYADKEKNTTSTIGPAFSILGESVPSTFYNSLTEEMIVEGLLPRFLLIEYNGVRVELNKHAATVQPPFQLVEMVAQLAANCKQLMHNNKTINVRMDETAQRLADDFDSFTTAKINQTSNEVVLNLWNRAHLKALKLAALIAVGVNPFDPVVIQEYIVWAINMVQTDIIRLAGKFETGEVGTNTGENKQQKEILRMVQDFIKKDYSEIEMYMSGGLPAQRQLMHSNRVIPYAYIHRRLIVQQAFKNDRLGATTAIKRAISTLVENDKLRELPKHEMQQKFGSTQRAFVISDLGIL